MDKYEKLIQNYDRIIEILSTQLIQFSNEESPNYSLIVQLEDEKNLIINDCTQLSRELDELNNDHIRSAARERIQEIDRITSQLKQIIERDYRLASGELKNINQKRLTLQTYGGVNYSDVISYYFDEKK